MSEIIDTLMKEHENILKFVEILEKKSNSMEKGIDKEFFEKAIEFIRNYADKFHHAKEEEILFKELCKAEGLHCNPIEQMLYEHDVGRNFVKQMEEGLKNKNKEKIIGGAKGYIQLIRDHIFKEDNILYPMANEVLNKDVQKSMLKKFESVEKEKKKDKEKAIAFVKSLK